MPPDNNETPPLEGEALQAHVTKLLFDHMQDVDKHFSDTMEQLEGLETTFTAKLMRGNLLGVARSSRIHEIYGGERG
jgi:hypothetical protein